jgi:type I site-specific restriction endonuclease
VTSDATTKDHFIIVDAVGVSEHAKVDTTRQLDRQPTVPLNQILNQVSFGSQDADVLSTLAARLARLQHKMTAEDHERLQAITEGRPLSTITHALLAAVDPDAPLARAAADCRKVSSRTRRSLPRLPPIGSRGDPDLHDQRPFPRPSSCACTSGRRNSSTTPTPTS